MGLRIADNTQWSARYITQFKKFTTYDVKTSYSHVIDTLNHLATRFSLNYEAPGGLLFPKDKPSFVIAKWPPTIFLGTPTPGGYIIFMLFTWAGGTWDFDRFTCFNYRPLVPHFVILTLIRHVNQGESGTRRTCNFGKAELRVYMFAWVPHLSNV